MVRNRSAKTPRTGAVPLKCPGKTVVLAGDKREHFLAAVAPQLIAAEGGKVVAEVTPDLDFVLVADPCPRGQWAAEKKAEQLNRRGAAIRVLDRADFSRLIAPTREEALALFQSG